jgi:hypothetical protein
MALHYFLFPFKILALMNILVDASFTLHFKQKSFSTQTETSICNEFSLVLKSFFYPVFTCKNNSQYTFINPYNAIATTEGRGGGGGGGGHGKDDWVIPNYSYHSNEFLFKNQQF